MPNAAFEQPSLRYRTEGFISPWLTPLHACWSAHVPIRAAIYITRYLSTKRDLRIMGHVTAFGFRQLNPVMKSVGTYLPRTSGSHVSASGQRTANPCGQAFVCRCERSRVQVCPRTDMTIKVNNRYSAPSFVCGAKRSQGSSVVPA